jgi:hypothetical protein
MMPHWQIEAEMAQLSVTARGLLVKGLIERVSLSISHYRLTEQGRAVFNELLGPPVNEQDGG